MQQGRILTLEKLRALGACKSGREAFRKIWGTEALVNQEWARQAAESNFLNYAHASWLVAHALPAEWYFKVYQKVREPYVRQHDRTYRLICFSIFAALYIEAGKT